MTITDLEIDLSGNHWKMEKIRPGAGVTEGFHKLPSEYQGTYFNWNQASVPGDVYTDLERAGELENLLMGRNMHRARWAMEHEYWYVCKFNTTEAMAGKRIRLVFEGVDYSFEAWLNGEYLGRHEGMYSSAHFDITDKARHDQWYEGCNILMIRLEPPPRNYRRVAGRKFCFAGDYMPGLVPFGIWRPVKVKASGDARIESARVESKLDGSDATVEVEVEIENLGDSAMELGVSARLSGENCEVAEINAEVTGGIAPGTGRLKLSIPVKDAKLWWPWDMGDQNLHQLELTLTQGGEVMDTRREVFGIREISMEMNPGFTPEEVENPWTFMVNGKRHFLRSICWGGPPSYFYGRNSEKKYADRLDMVREANINNLRIFGWHPPEIPYFYELCDRLGITVWTNFGFATQAFEATDEFLLPMLEDIRETVKDRRNHPSNIIWMGGEEVFFSHAHAESDNKLIMEKVGEVVAEETNIPYGIASPLSGEFGKKLGYKPKESVHANEHYYSAEEQTLMEEYYPSLDYCVIPELTAASAPSIESLRKFIPENELWPMGPSWGYHWADITILKMLNAEVFGDMRDGSLEDFVEATQTAHGIIAQFALEHFRRRKPRVSAVALCHFMTYLPDIKWGIIDYYGQKKTCFENVRRAYQPLLVSLEYTKRRWRSGEELEADIWIVNDHHQAHDGLTLAWRVLDPEGVLLGEGSKPVDVTADSSAKFHELRCVVQGEDLEFFSVEMELTDASGASISKNKHLLSVGDQQEAKQRCLQIHAELMEEKEELGKGYYRYHPELWDLD
ncbi:MAG: sugar-binding domain-containing protein [Verrucomicrobiota bacterium]